MSRALPIPAYRFTKKFSSKLVILPALVSTLVILAIGAIIYFYLEVSNQSTFLFITGGGIILVWLLTYLIIRHQTKPIQTITNALKDFAEGDWNRRINLKSNDELGLIAFTFNHIASEISQNYFSLNTGRLNINQAITAENGLLKPSEVYKTFRAITKANTQEEVLNVIHNFCARLPHSCYILEAERDGFALSGFYPKNTSRHQSLPSFIPLLPTDASNIFNNRPYIYITKEDSDVTVSLKEFINQIPTPGIYLFPIETNSTIVAIVGTCIEPHIDNENEVLMTLQTITKIATDINTKFIQIRNTAPNQEEKTGYPLIQNQSQPEFSLTEVCSEIHRQVSETMGDLLFYIALYDEASNQIEIPYIYDPTSEIKEIPPMPLGSGLTSIVIRSQQPLMIVEDTENKARALGARTMGTPAKSWLGVPIKSGESVIGAIIVQDLEQEHRFNDKDLAFLSKIASQASNSIRVSVNSENQKQHKNLDNTLFAITSQLREATDMQQVMHISISELAKALNAKRAIIELNVKPSLDEEAN